MQRLQDLGRLFAIYVQMTGFMTIYGHRVDLCTELVFPSSRYRKYNRVRIPSGLDFLQALISQLLKLSV